jgi:glycosyltransferase involved in cell wall biosynthesis
MHPEGITRTSRGKHAMPKIAYVLHRFPTLTDTFIRREIRSLQRAGTEVEVISVWRPRNLETTPELLAQWSSDTQFMLPKSPFAIAWAVACSMVRSPRRFLQTLRLAIATARPGLSGVGYQIVYLIEALLVAHILQRDGLRHAHNHNGDQSGTVTMLAAKLAGIGYSITFHGWPVFFDAKYSRIREKVLGASFTRSISYFCRSQLMMFSAIRDVTRFKIVHCGLNIENYDYQTPRRKIEVIFCTARLSPEKGHLFILEALKLLRDDGHHFHLRLAGDGPCKLELQDLARNLQIEDRVHFLGNVDEGRLVSELQNADLFVLSSFVEGIPVSAMEAMAAGVPVIATNVAGTSELIEDGKTGLLVRPSDARALVSAIMRMKEDYTFRLQATELARRKVSEEFDVDKETAKLNYYLLQSCL